MACLTAYIIFSALFVLSAALPASVTASTPTLIIRIPSSARNSSMARATAAAYLPPSWVTAGWVPISTYFLFIFDVLSIVALVAMSLNRFAAEELAFHLIDGAMWLLRYTLRTNHGRQAQHQHQLPPQSRDEPVIQDGLEWLDETGIF